MDTGGGKEETLDEFKRKKMMRQKEKGANERVRVFYPGQICFIYKHILIGLWGGKAQNTFLGI
jgi:hypothetical protein